MQHHHRSEFLPEHMGFIMLVPLLYPEQFFFVLGEIATGDQDAPLLYRPELVRVS